MTFTHLPQVAGFIRRTHCVFGHHVVSDAMNILGRMNATMIANPAVVGMTFTACTKREYGSVHTRIEINKLPSGAWEVTERAM